MLGEEAVAFKPGTLQHPLEVWEQQDSEEFGASGRRECCEALLERRIHLLEVHGDHASTV